MSRLRLEWRKELSRGLTIMVIPHGMGRPRQVSLSISFLASVFAVWTGFTAWAAYKASQNIDYWGARADTRRMRVKLDYFADRLHKSQEMMDQVKEMDQELRLMLNLGTREAVVQARPGDSLDDYLNAAGGPTPADTLALRRVLEGRLPEMSMEDVARECDRFDQTLEERVRSVKDLLSRIHQERAVFRTTPRLWPTAGYMTSHFGGRLSPFTGVWESHLGIDIAAPAGSPVRATADGVVQMASWSGGYGNVVVIDHGEGYSTRYGHNRQVVVKKGDPVKRGQTVALMGETGHATGPHCHYEVWYRGHPLNPVKFLKEHAL
jgi:murein DD-endopeptidase MepM/ murein hydrolase activator NlpD